MEHTSMEGSAEYMGMMVVEADFFVVQFRCGVLFAVE
jgi:hypothetical protein